MIEILKLPIPAADQKDTVDLNLRQLVLNIKAFDQPGVELGKVMAKNILSTK